MNIETIIFESKIEDGKIIVPSKYVSDLPNRFQVIIVAEKNESKTSKKKKEFKAFKVKSKGFKFDRDEANER